MSLQVKGAMNKLLRLEAQNKSKDKEALRLLMILATQIEEAGENVEKVDQYVELMYWQALNTCAELNGLDSEPVALLCIDFSKEYMHQGCFAEGEKLYSEAMRIYELRFSEPADWMQLYAKREEMAKYMMSQRLYERGFLLYKQMLESKERQLGTRHLELVPSLNQLVEVCKLRGLMAQACALPAPVVPLPCSCA